MSSSPFAAPRHARADETPGGRHRRPETLADTERPGSRVPRQRPDAAPTPAAARPLSPVPVPAADPSPDFHPADEAIRKARRAAGRAAYAAESSGRRKASPASPALSSPASPDPSPASLLPSAPAPADQAAPWPSPRPARPHRRRAASQRGRHAGRTDPLAITVRPLGAVKDWALDSSGRPPAIGSHRAPGTLPIESWLLVGKARQQALLAGLVAAGLALVMIPTAAQRTVDPISAAGTSTATTAPAPAPDRTRAPAGPRGGGGTQQQDRPARPGDEQDPPPASAPATPPAAEPPPVASEPPITVVPAGDGPHRSLRTTGSSVVALTFDDGPDPVQTPKILALLDKHRVKATFCLVGVQVQRHPEIVRQIAAAGHALCNHTWDHSLVIGKARPEQIAADLARTNQAIRAAAPDASIPFFRAPGGNFTDRLVQVAYFGGMTSLYWEVDPRDWEHRPVEDDGSHTERIVTEIQASVKPGAIVLSHDFNQPDTVAAYERLLPYLSENFELGLPSAHEAPPDL